MTRADISMLNYILGRFEGLACGADGEVQTGILDTCEQLSGLIEKFEREAEDGGREK